MVTEKYNHAFIKKVHISQMQTSSSLEMIHKITDGSKGVNVNPASL